MDIRIGTAKPAVALGPDTFIGQLAAELNRSRRFAFEVFEQGVPYARETIAEFAEFAESSTILHFTDPFYRRGLFSYDLDDISTFAQASATWAQEADGTIVGFAAGEPRVTDRGLLLEAAATNLVSPNLASGWTTGGVANVTLTTGVTAPDGTSTAATITDNSAVAAGNVNLDTAVGGGISAGVYTSSLFIKKRAAGGVFPMINVRWTGTTTNQSGYFLWFNPETGALSSNSAGVPAVEAVKGQDGSDWWRISEPRTITAHTNVFFIVYPACSATLGGAASNALTGSLTIWHPQAELGSVASSPASGTRAADALALALLAGEDDDVGTVDYEGGSAQIRRDALNDPLELDLASDVGAPWLGNYIAESSVVSATAALGKTVAALREVAEAGGQPATMASGSPTITYGLRNASPTLTGALTAWNSAGAFAFSGEAIVAGVSFPDTLMTRPRGVSYAADGSVWGAPGGWVEFEHTGDAFEIYQKGLTGGFRLWVDGELSANAYPDIPTAESAGGLHYTLVEFGGSATRRIRLESLAGSLSFGGVYVKTGQSVAAPSYPLRLILVGDSFTEGTGAGNQASGFAPMLAHELGVADFRNSGSGGTGWEQNNPSLSRVNLDDRWTRDVVDPAPDMVVVAMGYNDLEDGNDVAIGAMAAAKLNELREAVPGCLVHVLGPWDSNAYASAAPDADAVSLTAALEEACEGIPGVWFHSMLGVAFEPVGGGDIHPALGGHTTIAHHGYDEIAAVHGLRPRS